MELLTALGTYWEPFGDGHVQVEHDDPGSEPTGDGDRMLYTAHHAANTGGGGGETPKKAIHWLTFCHLVQEVHRSKILVKV